VIGEMHDFLAKLNEVRAVSRCNFQIHEKILFQYSIYNILFVCIFTLKLTMWGLKIV